MQRNSSPSSPSVSSLFIGELSVTVPLIGDPEPVPTGISSGDLLAAMVDTRQTDLRRLEETLTAALSGLSAKLADADRRREELEKSRNQTDLARDQTLKALRVEFVALQVQQNSLMSHIAGDGGAPPAAVPGGSTSRSNYFATRQSKVALPIFTGEDLAGWPLHCDRFFAVDLTLPEERVRLAVINLDGRALQWFHIWSRYHENVMETPWALFLHALEERFGDHLLGDPMTDLLSLKQTGSFSDYHDRFELLLGRVTLSEPYAISHFINGLRPYVQKAVRMFMPQTLVHAYALARLQEMSSSGRDGFSAMQTQTQIHKKTNVIDS